MTDEPTPIFDETAAAGAQAEPTPDESADPEAAAEPTPESNEEYVLSTLRHEDVNPEDHIGDETPDPWKDPEQKDWPMADDLQIRGDDDE